MSVMPVAAVLEMPRTGTCACWASGSAALAVFDSVGPRMALTLSRLMNFWKTVMPCSLVEASSSMTSVSFGPPPAATSSTAALIPARCWAPYDAAAPVRLRAAPITAPPPPEAAVEPPPLPGAGACEPWSLQAADARSSRSGSDQRGAAVMGPPGRRGPWRYRMRSPFARRTASAATSTGPPCYTPKRGDYGHHPGAAVEGG